MRKISIAKRVINLGGIIKLPERQDFLYAAILLLCQRASVWGMFPFGCVFLGALCGGQIFYLTIPAIFIGAVTSGASALKYTSAALIISAFKILLPKLEQNRPLSALICAGSVFLCGLYDAMVQGSYVVGGSLLFAEVILSCVSFAVFSNVNSLMEQQNKNEPISRENAVSLILLLGILIVGLSGIKLPFSINLQAVVTVYLILCMSMYSSASVSVTFALICGFISNIGNKNPITMGGLYAVSAVFSSLLKTFGQAGAAIGFLCGITFSALVIGDVSGFTISAADIFIASAFFAAVPLKYHQKLGVFIANTFKPPAPRRDFRIKEYVTEELNCFSHTFSEFARQFRNAFEKPPIATSVQASAIFDETADRICVNCNRFCDCWQKNFNDTYKYMFSILETTENSGFCDIHNAPIVFIQRCVQPELFLNEFNHIYEAKKQQSIFIGEQSAQRGLVSDQYNEISKIIGELSEDIEWNFFFDEQKEKQISAICSKNGIYLRDINVVKNNDGYYEVFFAPDSERDIESICEAASEVLDMKMEQSFSKNNSIVRLTPSPSFEISAAVCQKQRESETVCGDTVLHFKTDKNKYYIILCDGMGSGEEACRESRMTAELLGGFLKAGFSKRAAVNLINSTLALKLDREGYSTVDLCEIDLRSGKAEFIKIGAAQSYVRHGESIKTFAAKGLPAGICEHVSSENMDINLSDGDMIVMVSDGVSEAGYGMMRGEWVKNLMSAEGISAENLSDTIVSSARKRIYPRIPDDMTAVVIKICEV